jgi:CBS domain-containing membrane protein
MIMLLVRDLMTEDPKTVRLEDSLAHLYDLMDTLHVRHMPVVDEDGDLQGLVTHRDLVRGALHSDADLPVSNRRQMLQSIEVQEVMTAEPETATPRQTARDVAQLMLDNKFGCLPVVEGSRLVGIITESDFVRHVRDQIDSK